MKKGDKVLTPSFKEGIVQSTYRAKHLALGPGQSDLMVEVSFSFKGIITGEQMEAKNVYNEKELILLEEATDAES